MKTIGTMDVHAMPLRALINLQAEINIAIPRAKAAERSAVLDKMAATAAAHGLKLADLFGLAAARKARPALAASRSSVATKRSAKFANPKNAAETWSGRGRRPLWLAKRVKQGHSLAEFAV